MTLLRVTYRVLLATFSGVSNWVVVLRKLCRSGVFLRKRAFSAKKVALHLQFKYKVIYLLGLTAIMTQKSKQREQERVGCQEYVILPASEP